MAAMLAAQRVLRAPTAAQHAPSRRAACSAPRALQPRCRTADDSADAATLSRRRVGPLLLALAGAAALPPPPALAGLAAYDVTGKGVLEASVALGDANNALAFVPSELSFQQGRVYKLRVTNPSAVEHYFSAPTFASKVFTILVEVGGAEVKGAVTEVALEPGASLSWVFVPMKPGRYPLLCPVAGHVEGGMVGSIVVTPA